MGIVDQKNCYDPNIEAKKAYVQMSKHYPCASGDVMVYL